MQRRLDTLLKLDEEPEKDKHKFHEHQALVKHGLIDN